MITINTLTVIITILLTCIHPVNKEEFTNNVLHFKLSTESVLLPFSIWFDLFVNTLLQIQNSRGVESSNPAPPTLVESGGGVTSDWSECVFKNRNAQQFSIHEVSIVTNQPLQLKTISILFYLFQNNESEFYFITLGYYAFKQFGKAQMMMIYWHLINHPRCLGANCVTIQFTNRTDFYSVLFIHILSV